MQLMGNSEKLELYRKSLVTAWGYTDYNDWPVKLNSVFHLFLTEFGEELLDDIHYLESVKGYCTADIAALFKNPARVYRLIDSAVYSMRRRGFTLDEQRSEVLLLLDIVGAMKYGSEFNENGCNIIYAPDRIEDISMSLVASPPCSRTEAISVHRLCGLLWAYTESVFFRAHDVTKEIHGPYLPKSGCGKLVVKEYLNLRPTALWPQDYLLSAQEICVNLYYHPDFNIELDALNHLYIEGEKSPVDMLVHFDVRIDGKSVGTPEIESCMGEIRQLVPRNTARIDALDWTEKVQKYAEIFWFRKSPLRQARGIAWELPEYARENIRHGSPNSRRENRLSKEQVRRLAMLTI